jgi:hypothetical protein
VSSAAISLEWYISWIELLFPIGCLKREDWTLNNSECNTNGSSGDKIPWDRMKIQWQKINPQAHYYIRMQRSHYNSIRETKEKTALGCNKSQSHDSSTSESKSTGTLDCKKKSDDSSTTGTKFKTTLGWNNSQLQCLRMLTLSICCWGGISCPV